MGCSEPSGQRRGAPRDLKTSMKPSGSPQVMGLLVASGRNPQSRQRTSRLIRAGVGRAEAGPHHPTQLPAAPPKENRGSRPCLMQPLQFLWCLKSEVDPHRDYLRSPLC